MTAQPPRPLTRAEVREVDRRAIEDLGLPGLALMENAGRGLAAAIARLAPASLAIVCGTGNNGGDGWVAARHLALEGFAPRLILCGERSKVTGDAATNLGVLERAGVAYEVAPDGPALRALLAEPPALVVDALFGTGLQGELRPDGRAFVEALCACPTPVLAVDIPSGLCADSGRPLGLAVRAARTVTFVAPKQGFARAADYVGEVEVVSIGCPPEAWGHVSPGGTP